MTQQFFGLCKHDCLFTFTSFTLQGIRRQLTYPSGLRTAAPPLSQHKNEAVHCLLSCWKWWNDYDLSGSRHFHQLQPGTQQRPLSRRIWALHPTRQRWQPCEYSLQLFLDDFRKNLRIIQSKWMVLWSSFVCLSISSNFIMILPPWRQNSTSSTSLAQFWLH